MLFVDCREGLSGDMLLAALLGLVPEGVRQKMVQKMSNAAKARGLELSVIEIREHQESGIGISYTSKEAYDGEISYEDAHALMRQMSEELGSSSDLPQRILGLIFDAEAEAHGLPAKEVHLHEIGRPQAMLNIAAIGRVHQELMDASIGEIVASTIVTGKGVVVVSHGAIRLPAPASKILLRGMMHSLGDDPGERATPSGIAALKAMISRQSDERPEEPVMTAIGFGSKRFGGRLGRTTVLRA